MASLLSQYKGIRSTIPGTTLSFAMNFLIQTASLVASEVAMYSDLVVEFVVISYLELFQLTMPSLNT